MVSGSNIRRKRSTIVRMLKQFNRLRTGILVLATLTLLITSGTVEAKFRPAEQLSFDTFRLTSNIESDYCIITSQNVKEIAKDVELKEAYERAWNTAEDRNEKLEKQLDYSLWYFIGGFVIGVIVAK